MNTNRSLASLSRRRMLTMGLGLTGALLATPRGRNFAFAQNMSIDDDQVSPRWQSTINDIQEIIQAQGMVANGVLMIEIDRNDLPNVKRGNVPIKPAFEINGGLYFQDIGDGRVMMNSDMALKANEIDPFIDQLRSHSIVFQAEHQHGAINAYTARMAEATGFRALYLSGGGVAANSLGMPDLGISTMEDVLTDLRRITDVTTLPVLVDIDTGWGGAFSIARTIRSMEKAGAAAVHMEDQVGTKRCGHRPGKEVVSTGEMTDRIKAAVDARSDPAFVIMARTDALASEGLEAALDRARAYVEAGADMIFAEAVTELPQYRRFREAAGVPILANITEFGNTPLYPRHELAGAGVDIVLYCCGAYRAMNAAALAVYRAIRTEGTQAGVVPLMQTRAELYDFLGYHAYENKLDELFAAKNASVSTQTQKPERS